VDQEDQLTRLAHQVTERRKEVGAIFAMQDHVEVQQRDAAYGRTVENRPLKLDQVARRGGGTANGAIDVQHAVENAGAGDGPRVLQIHPRQRQRRTLGHVVDQAAPGVSLARDEQVYGTAAVEQLPHLVATVEPVERVGAELCPARVQELLPRGGVPLVAQVDPQRIRRRDRRGQTAVNSPNGNYRATRKRRIPIDGPLHFVGAERAGQVSGGENQEIDVGLVLQGVHLAHDRQAGFEPVAVDEHVDVSGLKAGHKPVENPVLLLMAVADEDPLCRHRHTLPPRP